MMMNARTVCYRLSLILLLLFSAGAHAQELEANVDREEISLNDTLTLTVRMSGRSLTGGPDFDALRRNFDMLSNQRSQQMRIVNGDMEAWTEWRLTLAPKRHGNLTIPAFEFEGSRSEPIEIRVAERQREPQSQGEPIFIETEVDKESIRVQEQVLFTVRLYSQVNLDAAEIQPLELDDAVIKAVDENNYITQIDDRQHLVLETTFALFPQKSGTLSIPPLTYEVALTRGQRNPWGRSNLQRLRTDGLEVEVQPKPDSIQSDTSLSDTWLPAKDLRLSEYWSNDPGSLRQGEPVTRRITLEADGLTSAQLPSLTFPETEGVTYYPDRPQTEEAVNASGVQSTSTYTVAMVPNRSGRVTLPPIEIQWWDTEAQRPRTASLPATDIQVQAVPGRDNGTSTSNERRSETASGSGSDSGNASLPLSTEPAPWLLWHWLWLGASVLLVLLCLWLTFISWRLKRELNAIYDLHHEDHRRDRMSQSQAWQAVKQAAQKQDLPKLRLALLNWGRVYWPTQPPQGLTEIADRLGSTALRQQFIELDAALYRGHSEPNSGKDEASTSFDIQAMLKELNQWRVSHRKQPRSEQGLKPLYRNRTQHQQ